MTKKSHSVFYYEIRSKSRHVIQLFTINSKKVTFLKVFGRDYVVSKKVKNIKHSVKRCFFSSHFFSGLLLDIPSRIMERQVQ